MRAALRSLPAMRTALKQVTDVRAFLVQQHTLESNLRAGRKSWQRRTVGKAESAESYWGTTGISDDFELGAIVARKQRCLRLYPLSGYGQLPWRLLSE